MATLRRLKNKENNNNNNIEHQTTTTLNINKIHECLNNGCEKMFKSMSSRSNHMKTCTHIRRSPRKKMKVTVQGGGVKYKCKHCPQLFAFSSSLYKHRRKCNPSRQHEGKEPITKPSKSATATNEFICTTCYKIFDRISKRDKHELTMHLGELDKYCVKCGRKFKRSDHYNNHVAMCTAHPQEMIGLGDDFGDDLGDELGYGPGDELGDEVGDPDLEMPSFILSADLFGTSRRNNELAGEMWEEMECSGADQREETEDILDGQSVEDLPTCSPFISSSEAVIEPNDLPTSSPFISSSEAVIEPNDLPTCSLFISSGEAVIEPNNLPTFDYTSLQSLDNSVDLDASVQTNQSNQEPTDGDSSDDNSDDNISDYKDIICDAVVADLRDNKSDSEYIFSRLYSFFGVRITYDLELQKWLAKAFYGPRKRKQRFVERLFRWLKPKIEIPRRHGPAYTPEQRQLIFDTWIDNSTISVDRRDGRDSVRIPKGVYNKRFFSIETSLVSFLKNKRNAEIAQAPRYICHMTTSEILKVLEDKHGSKFCRGSVHNLRPFFVENPTDREKLECLCTVCCNIRLLFQAVQRRAKKNSLPEFQSITSYFTNNKNCGNDRNGFISHSCLTGSCENCSGIIDPHPYSFKEDDVVTYYQFELVSTGKLNKKGKPKKKTQRVDYNSVSTTSLVEKLNATASRYLLHRYDVCTDKTIWPLIQEACNEKGVYIVHMDFSENIKEKPKFETQPHHFSGQQHSLHCSFAETPDGNIYFYHFSDEIQHDWRFTKAVILDLIKKLFKDQIILRFKTDNCTVQYKCLHVFGMYLALAKFLGKKIIVYYGAAGHGRCLVDGMSSWGVKNPLRKLIIIADFWWLHASQLVKLFHDKGFQCENRDYSELTVDYIQSFPKDSAKKIPGCTKYHMIVFNPDNTFECKEDLCECDMCFTGLFGKCMYGENDDGENNDEENDDGDEEDDDAEDKDPGDDDDDDDDGVNDLRFDMLCEMMEPGKIIALRTHELERQSFYLVSINEVVRNSPVDAFDCFNHCINKGDNYISCVYLEIDTVTKRYVKYRRCSSKVFVLPGEVLSPFVDISEDLVLKMDEKQWLDDMA